MKPDISIAWATKHIDCTPEGRRICQGKCCTMKSPMGQGRYLSEELSKLPAHIKNQLDEHRVVKKEHDAPCPLIDDCLKHPEWKPIQCKLYPFLIRNNKLVMRRGIFHCPNWNKGEQTVFENCKQDLIEIFGEEWYDEKELQLKS